MITVLRRFKGSQINLKDICLKYHELRKHFHLFFIYLFLPKLQREYKQNINKIEYEIMLQY